MHIPATLYMPAKPTGSRVVTEIGRLHEELLFRLLRLR